MPEGRVRRTWCMQGGSAGLLTVVLLQRSPVDIVSVCAHHHNESVV